MPTASSSAAVWVVTVAGVFALAAVRGASAGTSSRRALVGGLLLGWGGFNVVEGIVDHHLLDLHHVRPGPDQLLYDVAFLAWGGVMVAAGLALGRGVRAAAAGPGGG